MSSASFASAPELEQVLDQIQPEQTKLVIVDLDKGKIGDVNAALIGSAILNHIGIYAYRRAALQRFVGLPPAPLELREKLEQLRALEAGMRIDVAIVDSVPLGVDTPADLARARAVLSERA